MNNLSTNQLILGSGLLTATGNSLYLNGSLVSLSSNNLTGSFTVNSTFNLQPFISGGNFTLSNNPFYVNTGSLSNFWTLPAISSCTGRIYQLKNRGAGFILTGQIGDALFPDQKTLSMTINSGDAYSIYNDGQIWNIV